MRVIFACGGTAGHINPAIAIADKLTENEDNKVLFIGTQKGMEARLVPASGYDIKFIEISGLNRKDVLKNALLPSKVLKSIKQSEEIIGGFKPDVVIGTGGYVTLPVIYAAHKLGIKTLIHEVNSVPGLATKFLAKRADYITTAFEDTAKTIKTSKAVKWVGNPIRPELLDQSMTLTRKKLGLDERPVLLVFGGSLGAQVLNLTIEKLSIVNDRRYQILWGCGERYYDELKTRITDKDTRLMPYIDNMGEMLAASDVVITRAGGVLFEILALGKAAIIIPSPNVTANHQVRNAEVLAKKGAINMLLECDIDKLPQLIEETLKNRETLEAKALANSKPNATEDIIKLIMESENRTASN